jgi:hypothetical protein
MLLHKENNEDTSRFISQINEFSTRYSETKTKLQDVSFPFIDLSAATICRSSVLL